MATRFHDLWKRSLDHADDIFPRMFDSTSPLKLWHPGDSIASTGSRILVAVATYAFNDMSLLDWLEENMKDFHPPVKVDVVLRKDAYGTDSDSRTEWEQCFPGTPIRLTTPIVGLWIDGMLTEMSLGANTLVFIKERFTSRYRS